MSYNLSVQILGGRVGIGIAYLMNWYSEQRDTRVEAELKEQQKVELELFRKEKLRELSNK